MDNTKSNNIIVYGKNYLDAYQQFPVDIFYIKILRDVVRTGRYDEEKSGYNENGEYCIYIEISEVGIYSILNHELRHAFEDYNRISKNKTRLSKSKEANQYYNSDFEQLILGNIKGIFDPFNEILYSLYLTSKMEESGFSETVYDKPNSVIDEIKKILKKNYLYDLNDVNIANRRWNDLKSKVNIPILNKFNNYQNFVEWADNVIQKRAIKVYKKLQKVKYLSKQKGVD
jgi:hypothetical protein